MVCLFSSGSWRRPSWPGLQQKRRFCPQTGYWPAPQSRPTPEPPGSSERRWAGRSVWPYTETWRCRTGSSLPDLYSCWVETVSWFSFVKRILPVVALGSSAQRKARLSPRGTWTHLHRFTLPTEFTCFAVVLCRERSRSSEVVTVPFFPLGSFVPSVCLDVRFLLSLFLHFLRWSQSLLAASQSCSETLECECTSRHHVHLTACQTPDAGSANWRFVCLKWSTLEASCGTSHT